MSFSIKETVQAVNDAFNSNDIEAFLSCCTEDIRWSVIGDFSMAGKVHLRDFMSKMEPGDGVDIHTDKIIADGETAVCTGTFSMMKQGNASAPSAFCDVYHFEEGKIKELNSYVVKLKQTDVADAK